MAKSDVLEEFDVKRLNTVECIPTGEGSEDIRFMHCEVHAFGEPPKTLGRIVSVEGRIQVLSAWEKGRIYIKTSPYIGMPARITVKPHYPTKGNIIHVEPRGHPLL